MAGMIKIITGDLGKIGKQALAEFIRNEGLEAEEFLMDCGMEIYDSSDQDTHAGGSGCGCSAAVLCGYILPRIQQGEWKRVLLCPQEPCFPRSASMKEKASQASPWGGPGTHGRRKKVNKTERKADVQWNIYGRFWWED